MRYLVLTVKDRWTHDCSMYAKSTIFVHVILANVIITRAIVSP